MLGAKPRVTMCCRVLLFLIGVVYINYQVLASVPDVYIAELMVESNATLDIETIQSVLNTTTGFTVTDGNGVSYEVSLEHNELVAECLIIGDQFSCNCSTGYIWSNEVCYTYDCCRETTCKQNVSLITPLCVAKVKVKINGSVTLNVAWDASKTTELENAFGKLNGFESVNITGQRLDSTIADFEAAVSVKFPTSKLQTIISDLETAWGAVIWVDTTGMVTMEAPETSVCYMSSPILTCTFEELTDFAGWNVSRPHERFELNKGTVVNLNHSCSTDQYQSCIGVELRKVTGVWAGIYECGFMRGSVRHTAKAPLKVALLPDVITLKINPLTVDCSESPAGVKVTATILNITESFDVRWSYRGTFQSPLHGTADEDYVNYEFQAPMDCTKTTDAQYIHVTFKNTKEQEKSARVDIPVIYDGERFCPEDIVNGEVWPKTPAGNTVLNRTCQPGRVGYKSRTCEGTTWQLVSSFCVNEELSKVVNAADNFLKGLGATQEVALDIFAGLKNSSLLESDTTDTMADITASVNVLHLMASASGNVVLEDSVIPDFVDAASNMLNKTWGGTNQSTIENMSSSYLQSVEDLVKNIKINNTDNEIHSQNLELKFCTSGLCNMSVFDISVNLNKTKGIMKTVAVKNLTDKLRNNYRKTVPSSLLLSATVGGHNDSSLEIRLAFPKEQTGSKKSHCVFWNTTAKDWSDTGCSLKATDANQTFCVCNHLTSFAVLMSKTDISTDVLDIITSVGLGVSVCSLLIFLIIESLVWSAVVKSNLSLFRHTALVNIATFLLLANCSFLASTSPDTLSDTWCLVFTIFKHLFYLAMFSWMMCMSVMLVHQLIFVFSPLRKRVFMFISSIVGYVCPILIVGSSYVYCKYTNKPYYNRETCWLVFERILEGSMHAFLIPIGTVILTNLFSMVVVILTLVKSSVPDGSKADDKETAKSILKVVVFLTPVFGVTWIIGFAQFMLDEGSPLGQVAIYAFTILNSFQGLLILITGCFAEQKVRQELLKLIMAKSRRNSESMKNLTSTAHTKNK